MSRTLPPLVALRSFESAARHLSFKDAAEELSVTPSAVSHQIHNLETFLGVRLFHRMNRALRLSGAGEAYVLKVRMAFDQIEQATRDLTSAAEADVLTLSAPPSLTATWLVPRLKGFRERFPSFDVRVKGTMDDIDYGRDTVDASIRYGYGDWQGVEVEHLSTERMLVLCSPALLRGGVPLERPEDVLRHPLIHSECRLTSWNDWLRAAGVPDAETPGGFRFTHSAHSLRAAADGLGIALENDLMAADYLADGNLVVPFVVDFVVPRPAGYYFVCPTENLLQPKIQAVRAWVRAEFRISDELAMARPSKTAAVG
ncbi:Glycine cleavage system transcriptional activator [uncultured Alphaproteobacteria bacterium]|uniref:Glycine cleavage system transcriptional activator n=1 Tax=uncultured Alphaproteobacteria bacterium TaxID=91750 RepID=A0A212K8B9_9PROT|nr:Glycine cleavage system transcriptional activator [uncultured Alphaproteobacteria bacterium]